MYPLKLESILEQTGLLKKPILFFSCISFEVRCKTATNMISRLMDSEDVWGFFKLIDNGSYYERECSDEQEKIKNEITKSIGINEIVIPEYLLFDSQPWEDLIFYFKDLVEKNSGVKTVILDITTIPKVCYFPFLKWLLSEGLSDQDFIIVYTKPGGYGGSKLESDPTSPKLLIGDYREEKDIIWIPSLGFKPSFTKTILEKIREIEKEIEIKPMIGFPAYRQDYYDKVLILHVKEEDRELTKSLEMPILATADDPFEVYKKLIDVVDDNPGKDIILSPVGPKPMAVGMALAAIERELPVIAIQPKTYHPDYSTGEGEVSAYWIKRDGDYTF